jgi:predicted dehydrogenase
VSGPLRLGIVGVGSLGRHHARVASANPGIAVSGVFDTDGGRAAEVAREFSLPVAATLEELLGRSEALIVAAPTVSHHAVASAALGAGRHVLVEKPMAATLAEADDLLALASRHGTVLQVGHVERFNPAVVAALPHAREPRFIEAHRLGVFTARSLDVDVVLDLMIHDIQVAQAVVGREVQEVRAAGVAVLTPRIDIANARIAFEGGCVANLTASRVSADRVRKFRIFAPSLYISIDTAAQEIGAYRLEKRPDGPSSIVPALIPVSREEPLKREIEGFRAACRGEAPSVVTGLDGRRALALALEVRDAIEEHQRSLA